MGNSQCARDEPPAKYVVNLLDEEKGMAESMKLVADNPDTTRELIEDLDHYKRTNGLHHGTNLTNLAARHPSGLALVADHLHRCCNKPIAPISINIGFAGDALETKLSDEKLDSLTFPSVEPLSWGGPATVEKAGAAGAGAAQAHPEESQELPAASDAYFDNWEFGLEGAPAVKLAEFKALPVGKGGSHSVREPFGSTTKEMGLLRGILGGNLPECCALSRPGEACSQIRTRDSIRKPPKLWRSAAGADDEAGGDSRSGSKDVPPPMRPPITAPVTRP